MKHKLILKLKASLTSFFIMLPCIASAEGGVMFSNVALKEYGVMNFSMSHPRIVELPLMTKVNVGKIEGEAGIDTEPEAAIALWLESPQQIETLPRNELGVKRLCFDLYVRMAEFPDKKKSYLKAVNLVLKMAKEKHQVSVTLSDARKFYEEAIKEKIYATPLGAPLTADEQKKVKELLLAYMIQPGKKTQNSFLDFSESIIYRNLKKADVIANFAYNISPELIGKLA